MAPKAELIAKLTGEPVKAPEPTNPMKLESKGTENPSPPAIAEVPPVEPAKTELESTRFASIAKREAKLVARDAELKAREEAIKGLEADYKTKLTPFQEFEVLRSKDPVAALRSLGFSETDIFNWMSETGEKKEPTVEERAAAAAQEEIKKENDRRSTAEKQAQQKREEETIERFRGEIKSVITANPEKYEFCNFNGPIAEQIILNTVTQVLRDSDEMITADEAAQIVEEYFENDYKEAQAKIKKLQPKTLAPETATIAEASPPPAATAPKPKTLTNAATATVASTANRRETREEKRARLEEALRNGGIAKAA